MPSALTFFIMTPPTFFYAYDPITTGRDTWDSQHKQGRPPFEDQAGAGREDAAHTLGRSRQPAVTSQ